MKRFLQKYILLLLAVIALIGSIIWTAISYTKVQKRYADVKAEQTKISEQNMKVLSRSKQDIENSLDVDGVDKSRVVVDMNTMESDLQAVFTWNTYDSYVDARNKAKELFKLSDSDSFLTTFFPDAEDSDDWSLNMTYQDMEMNLVDFDGDTYSYFTTVVVSSSGTTDSGDSVTGSATIVMTFDTDADSKISNMKAWTVAG